MISKSLDFISCSSLSLILLCFVSSKVPAFLNVTDIAGLVKGASNGEVS